MTYTEIKEKGEKKYYYRVKSIRKGEKVDKQRVYLGGNLKKQELHEKEHEADKKLLNIQEKKIEIKEIEASKNLGSLGSNKKSENNTGSSIKKLDISDKKITFNIDKNKDFSDWYTEIIQKAELADLRYNIKG